MNTFINGDRWAVHVLEHDEYVRNFGEGHEAFCDAKTKQIFFNEDDLTKLVVKHELWHAYVSYCYLTDAEVDASGMEEASAELFAQRGDKISRQASNLYRRLNK